VREEVLGPAVPVVEVMHEGLPTCEILVTINRQVAAIFLDPTGAA
jgi:hypothetical protein